MQYLILAYQCNCNTILVAPFSTKHDRHCIHAYNSIMNRFKRRGDKVSHQVLGNESSQEYRCVITEEWQCTY